ncbi:MAG: SusC/RagA family TonB-linked outer membrane protein [Phycisphaeraceae bacterium]|nr:SusC/RagA family TonB-linked outer membrane protein [Phycisphaeraceae bacterium]
MNANLQKVVIRMSKLAIYVLIACQTISMVTATESTAQRKYLDEIEIVISNASGSRALLSLIKEIEYESHFKFAYTKGELKKKIVDLNGGRWNLRELLTEVSSQAEVSIQRVNESIALVEAGKSSSLPNVAERIVTQVSVSGKVTDENGEPLPGATIQEKGTTNGSITDVEGKFNLRVEEGAILTVSFVGYASQDIQVNGRSVIDITMEPDMSSLEEVVVVGYGLEVDKKDLTGSVAKADLDHALGTSNVSIIQALQGAIPGLNVGAVTNAGQNPTISVRAQNTLSSEASDNAPLIVLDGIIYRGNIIDINPSDIKSVEVLKDVSSAAIYGSQASNGVIVITTKGRSVISKPTFNYTMSHSIQAPSNQFTPMRADEYEGFYRDIFWAEGSRIGPDYLEEDPNYDLTANMKSLEIVNGYMDGLDTRWWDLFTGNGHTTNHNLSVQGGGESSSYFISGGYTDQAAFIEGDTYKRYNLRINLETDITDWMKIGTQTFVSVGDYSGVDPGPDVIFQAQPWAPIYDDQGEIIAQPDGSWINPYLRLNREDVDIDVNLSSVLFTQIKLPINGLTYRLNYANNYRTTDRRFFDPNANNFTGLAYRQDGKQWDWTFDNIVNYSRTFNSVHNVAATLLYGVEERRLDSFRATAQNFENDLLGFNLLEAGDPALNMVRSNFERETSLYQMARVLYNYKHKYYFTGTVRRDGFSGFGEDKKIGVFPSVALGWVLSEESFMKTLSAIDFLKLRASYGQSGRRGVDRYSTQAKVSSGPSYIFGDGGSASIGQSVASIANTSLGWETTTGTNLAIDFGIFGSRVSGSLEYYSNVTNNIIYDIEIPEITGFNSVNTNIAEVSNSGVELMLNGRVLDNGPLKWDISFNFNRLRNKIESIIGADIDEDGIEDDLVSSELFIGEPQNVIYDYEIVGMWQLEDEESGEIWDGFLPGTYKLRDINGDTAISSLDDRKILGYKDPSFRFGIGNTLSYKNFGLYFFINSIQGGKNYYMGNDAPHATSRWSNRDQLSYLNVPSGAWDYWMPENPNAKYRRLDNGGSYGGTPYSQRSFVRLQDVSLSYNLPTSWLEKLRIQSARITVSGKNLLTWTDWIGVDPETGTGFVPGRPLLRSYTMGLDVKF